MAGHATAIRAMGDGLSWMVCTFPLIEVGHVRDAVGYWPIRAMTRNPCGSIATAIECSR